MNTDQIIIEEFIRNHTTDAVQILEKLAYHEIAALLKEITEDLAIEVLSSMNSYIAAKSLEAMEISNAVVMAEKFDLLLLELILRQSNESFRHELLNRIPKDLAEKIRHKLKYSAESVGSLMNIKYFSLPAFKTVKEALKTLKGRKELKTSEIYVTDKEKKIVGILGLHDLLTANEQDLLSAVMIKDIPKFQADESIQTLNNQMVWMEYKSVPVVDRSGLLIGTLRFEDIKKVSQLSDQESKKQIIETANALGELYRIGLTGLLQSTGKIGNK